jgi:hypothetical protein
VLEKLFRIRAPIAVFSETCDAENANSSTTIRPGRTDDAVVNGGPLESGVTVAPAHPASVTASARPNNRFRLEATASRMLDFTLLCPKMSRA